MPVWHGVEVIVTQGIDPGDHLGQHGISIGADILRLDGMGDGVGFLQAQAAAEAWCREDSAGCPPFLHTSKSRLRCCLVWRYHRDALSHERDILARHMVVDGRDFLIVES